ncbi:MAG: restriction endonuclease [Candidatus Dadabacteria bacterium]|nr:restriction endonuclease [Candidatus Dadabacteria bacterium]
MILYLVFCFVKCIITIKSSHSHLNGEECMLVRYGELWMDIRTVIESVDAEACRVRVFTEKDGQQENLLVSPEEISKRFKDGFESRGWQQRRAAFWVMRNGNLLRNVREMSGDEKGCGIKRSEHEAIRYYNRPCFAKGRVAVELQFDDYAFTSRELFAEHLSSYVSDMIDVGIEILPVKDLERKMSSGVPCYERGVLNLLKQGRGVPPVPLVLIGIGS